MRNLEEGAKREAPLNSLISVQHSRTEGIREKGKYVHDSIMDIINSDPNISFFFLDYSL